MAGQSAFFQKSRRAEKSASFHKKSRRAVESEFFKKQGGQGKPHPLKIKEGRKIRIL